MSLWVSHCNSLLPQSTVLVPPFALSETSCELEGGDWLPAEWVGGACDWLLPSQCGEVARRSWPVHKLPHPMPSCCLCICDCHSAPRPVWREGPSRPAVLGSPLPGALSEASELLPREVGLGGCPWACGLAVEHCQGARPIPSLTGNPDLRDTWVNGHGHERGHMALLLSRQLGHGVEAHGLPSQSPS